MTGLNRYVIAVEINGRGLLSECRWSLAGRVREFHVRIPGIRIPGIGFDVLVFDPSHPARKHRQPRPRGVSLRFPRFAAASGARRPVSPYMKERSIELLCCSWAR